MAQTSRAAKAVQNELLSRALAVLRKKAKKSSEEGMLQLESPGGTAALLARELKLSPYGANKLAKELARQGLVRSQSRGPGTPRLIMIKAEGEPKARRGPRKPTPGSGSRKKTTARRRRSTGNRRKTTSRRRRTVTKAPESVDELIAQLQASYTALEARNSELEAELEQVKAQADELKARLDQARDALK